MSDSKVEQRRLDIYMEPKDITGTVYVRVKGMTKAEYECVQARRSRANQLYEWITIKKKGYELAITPGRFRDDTVDVVIDEIKEFCRNGNIRAEEHDFRPVASKLAALFAKETRKRLARVKNSSSLWL